MPSDAKRWPRYLTEDDKANLYYNIPIANTTSIPLGTDTFVTQAAMRLLSQAGVLVGFCGGGGMPLFMGTEREVYVEWMTPQSEYRPTEYIQGWMSWWWDDDKRLAAAKMLQHARLGYLQAIWSKDIDYKRWGFNSNKIPKRSSLRREIKGASIPLYLERQL